MYAACWGIVCFGAVVGVTGVASNIALVANYTL